VLLPEDNPTIEIEVYSHTDSRGSGAGNLSLSENPVSCAGAEHQTNCRTEFKVLKY